MLHPTHSADNDMKPEFQTKPHPAPDNKANGEIIRGLRKEADMTAKDLAEALDIHPSYMSDLEQGNRGFSEDMFNRAKDAIAKHQKKAK